MAWAPKYGLKGMIDASVKVKVESTRTVADGKVVPLEFKTGKVPSGQVSILFLLKNYVLTIAITYLRNYSNVTLFLDVVFLLANTCLLCSHLWNILPK